MDAPAAYEALAEAFLAEGVDTLFTLLGDANLHFGTALSARPGVRTFHVRHEHCACVMAIGYAMATGKVGVASVTSGPGITQTMTALATAAQARAPLVVLVGETPLASAWSNQDVDQAAVVSAVGARYITVHDLSRLLDSVSEAFYTAQFERCPVVIGVPYDLQRKTLPKPFAYRPSRDYLPEVGRTPPDPAFARRAAEMIAAARRPILIAGRGVMKADAARQCEAFAEMTGSLLSTTLPARGMFDHNAFSVGIAGGFSLPIAREMFSEADLVLGVGASMTHFTLDGGALFPQAAVVQIDAEPLGRRHGLRAADLYVKADVRAALEAIGAAYRALPPGAEKWRSAALAQRIASHPGDTDEFDIAPKTLDPRRAIAAFDSLIPKDWEIVGGAGHSSYFHSHLRGRAPEHFHVCREYGAIGNALALAMGVAAAKPEAHVVLIDGDGSFLMHVQELETIARHHLRLLICVMNDGGFGAEFHKLRGDGMDDRGMMFGFGDLARVARGFGLDGAVIEDDAQFRPALKAYLEGGRATVWDMRISDRVPVPKLRKAQARHRPAKTPAE